MAFTVNQVTLLGGNLTRDGELKYAKNGQAILRFDIAMNKGYFDKQSNQWVKQDPDFFKVVFFGKSAEKISSRLLKGTKVDISGRLQQNRWTTDDGQTRSIIEIAANSVFVVEKIEQQDFDQQQPQNNNGHQYYNQQYQNQQYQQQNFNQQDFNDTEVPF